MIPTPDELSNMRCSVRVNGNLVCVFAHSYLAIKCAYDMRIEFKSATIEVWDLYNGELLKLTPEGGANYGQPLEDEAYKNLRSQLGMET